MIPLPGLTASEYALLEQDLRLGPYIATPSVQLLDLDHNELDDVSGRLLDGQVDWKLGLAGSKGGAVSASSAQLSLADPRRIVALDAGTAVKGAVFYDQMISAGMVVEGPRLGRPVRIPIFTGPITKAVRAAGQLSLTCEGKERLATGMVGQSVTYKKSKDKIAVIRDLLARAGEADRRIKTPGNSSNLPDDLVLLDTDMPWPEIRQLVASMDRQALYDARGDFRMRSLPGDPVLSITDGDGGNLLSIPEVTHDGYGGYNGVRVRGHNKAGKQISVTVWLPPSHPLSPGNRKRNGVPFRRLLKIEQPRVRDGAEANKLAIRHLRSMSHEYVKVTAEIMPNWLLEPGDIVAFRTRELGYLTNTLAEFSVPLVPGAGVTVGANRVIARPKPKPGKPRVTGGRKPRDARVRVPSSTGAA